MTKTSSLSFGKVLVLLAVFILFILGASAIAPAFATAARGASEGARWHSVEKHGADATAVIQACQNRGVWKIYVEQDRKTFHQLCQLDDGRIGDLIVRSDKEIRGGELPKNAKLEPCSSFVPRQGVWSSIRQWLELSRRATPFKGYWGPVQ